ncbi:MAG: FecR protein [Elusimicrobia bacterium]|nr:MAG: FecR protein [Elusimicrobiota bacterium]
MKTLSRPLAALALLIGLSAPAAALWPFSDPAPAGPLGAVLAEAQGAVFVQKAGAAEATSGAAQTALDAGDVVKTGAGGRAVVAFLDGSKMQIKENGSFAVSGHSAKKVSVKIDIGTIQYWITKQAKRRRYEMRTPTAVASVRGTSGEVEVSASGDTSFAQWTGSVDVTDSAGREVRLEPNQIPRGRQGRSPANRQAARTRAHLHGSPSDHDRVQGSDHDHRGDGRRGNDDFGVRHHDQYDQPDPGRQFPRLRLDAVRRRDS